VLNVKQQFNGFPNDDPSSSNPITALSISREGDVAIAGCASGIVRLFNLIDGEFTEQITDHPAPVTQVALSHSYLFSLSGSKDTTVKVYDNEMGEIVAEFTVNQNDLFSFSLKKLPFLLGALSSYITCTYIRR
jgi:WD40 repeat protein